MAVAKKTATTTEAARAAAETVAASAETMTRAVTEPLSAVQENVRSLTEKTIEQARTQYATLKKAAEDATGTVETSFSALSDGMIALNTKALESLRANANATFDHLAALQGAKSFAEAIELSAAHARAQMDALTAQTRQFQALVQKTANDAVAPLKSAIVSKR